jgi:transposase-like protein
MDSGGVRSVPSWVPKGAMLYLAHTEQGSSIRALARQNGCHASTVMRRIRHYETRRDDPMVDEALRRLGCHVAPREKVGSPLKETAMTTQAQTRPCDVAEVTEAQLMREAGRILRRLAEAGAVLAVAVHMDKAVVVRGDGTAGGDATRTATLDRAVAEAMALKGWIACDAPGRLARYHITKAGRTVLGELLAMAENRASGFADAQAPFSMKEGGEAASGRIRYAASDSPLAALARRRGSDGARFVPDDLVRAGERLREDFELSQMGPRVTQDWSRFLTAPGGGSGMNGPARGFEAARRRVEGALHDLGPGLGDIALRCCCHLEGLEKAEKRMGWSARSGKIVLRIALQRLKRHYDSLGEAGGMIG